MPHPIKCLSDDESRRLIAYCLAALESFPFSYSWALRVNLVMLLHETGLRIGEAVQLIWLDFYSCETLLTTLRVRSEIAKNNVERCIPLSQHTKFCLHHLHSLWASTCMLGDSSFVFPGRIIDYHITIRQAQNIVRIVTSTAICRPVNPHLLRHTFATRLMRVANARVVQQLLGHSSLESTQIYTHPNDQDLKEAIDKSSATGSFI